MGTRGYDDESPRRRHRHGSHRRPHGAEGKRRDSFDDGGMDDRDYDSEIPRRRRHGSHRRPHGAGERRRESFDDGGMDDFVDDFEGMSMGSRGCGTRGGFDDSGSLRGGFEGKAHYADGFVPDMDDRHVHPAPDEYRHGEHRHREHRHREHRHREHRHKEHGHKEHGHEKHRHGEEHFHKEHRHKEHQDEEHRHKDHGYKKHGHKHEHEGHHHGEHRHGETKHADHRRKMSWSGGLQTSMTEKEFGRKLYDSALIHFREGSGSSYPCSQSEIDFHHNGVLDKANKGPLVSPMQATNEIMRWNDEKRAPPREELDIIRSLSTAVREAERTSNFGPDLIIKTFADLDRVFFGGRLRGHVTVKWFKRVEIGLGQTIYHRPGQCRIQMNAEDVLLPRNWKSLGWNPVAIMFGVLLHEMCHAYQMARCPIEAWRSHDGHDSHFQTQICVVHDRAIRILGIWAVGGWEGYTQQHFLPSEGEQRRKEGRARQDGGKKRWGDQKGTDCVVM